MWSIYLLSDGTRTYVGSTTDVTRRLRQHNGEIRGGARSTRGRTWKIICWISGFENRSSACRWERIVKCRARGIGPRSLAMYQLTKGICPRRKSNHRYYEPPKGLELHE